MHFKVVLVKVIMIGKLFILLFALSAAVSAKAVLQEGENLPSYPIDQNHWVEEDGGSFLDFNNEASGYNRRRTSTQEVGNRIFEDKIESAIEMFRQLLKKGIPSMQIPPFDPLVLGNQEFDFFIEDTALAGYLKNTTFKHFSDFVVKNLRFKLTELSFDVVLDKLTVEGLYKVKGHLFNEIHLDRMGWFLSETENVTVSVSVGIHEVDDRLQIENLEVTCSIMHSKLKYTNVLIDNEIRTVDEEKIMSIINKFMEKYLAQLLEAGKEVVNDILKSYSYEEIFDLVWFVIDM